MKGFVKFPEIKDNLRFEDSNTRVLIMLRQPCMQTDPTIETWHQWVMNFIINLSNQ